MSSTVFFFFFPLLTSFKFYVLDFRFMYIIRSDAGQPLREELAKSPDKIIASGFPDFLPHSDASGTQGSFNHSTSMKEEGHMNQPESSVPSSTNTGGTQDAYFQCLVMIKTLVKLMPGWLQSNRIVFNTLVLLWKSPARISRLQNEQELNLVQVSLQAF